MSWILLESCQSVGTGYGRYVNLGAVLGGTARLDGEFNYRGDGFIRDARDLQCSDWGSGCRWHNERGSEERAEIDELDYGRAIGRANPTRLQAITGTTEIPGGADNRFLITGSRRTRNAFDSAMLVSDPIGCQENDGELRFRYWTSPYAEIKVCVRQIDAGRNFDYCSRPITSGDPGPATVTIPGPIPYPFEIVIVSSGFTYNQANIHGGLVILDDLDYNARICNDGGGFTNYPLGFGDEAACQVLSCSFDAGRCINNLLRTGWKTAAGPVGNFHTGIRIPYRGAYGYAEGPATDAVLRSAPFQLQQPRTLNFCYYRAVADTQLIISGLINGQMQTLYTSPQISGSGFGAHSPPIMYPQSSPMSFPMSPHSPFDRSPNFDRHSPNFPSSSSTYSSSNFRGSGYSSNYPFSSYSSPNVPPYDSPNNFLHRSSSNLLQTSSNLFNDFQRRPKRNSMPLNYFPPQQIFPPQQQMFNNPGTHCWICDQAQLPPGRYDGIQFDVQNLANQFAYFGIDEIMLTNGGVPLCTPV